MITAVEARKLAESTVAYHIDDMTRKIIEAAESGETNLYFNLSGIKESSVEIIRGILSNYGFETYLNYDTKLMKISW